MTYKNGNSENDVVICRVGNVPEHGILMHIRQCWYLTPCCGLEVQKPNQALFKSVKGQVNDLNPKGEKTLPLGIFMGFL